jgi:hypothetical protein
VYAVDRDAHALAQIARTQGDVGARASIRTVVGDFTEPVELPPLDGLVIANALHFVPYADQARVLRQIAAIVRSNAPLVVVEYERRDANPWVPYPVTAALLGAIAREAGLGAPAVVATTPSRFSGTIYSAIVRRE